MLQNIYILYLNNVNYYSYIGTPIDFVTINCLTCEKSNDLSMLL